jgi:hypothetical protein
MVTITGGGITTPIDRLGIINDIAGGRLEVLSKKDGVVDQPKEDARPKAKKDK